MIRRKSALYVIFILFIMLILAGCQEREKARVEKEAIPVRVIKVELKSIKNTLDYVDDIKA